MTIEYLPVSKVAEAVGLIESERALIESEKIPLIGNRSVLDIVCPNCGAPPQRLCYEPQRPVRSAHIDRYMKAGLI